MVGEHSIVWLEGRLVIYPPRIFGETFPFTRDWEFQIRINEDITDIKMVYSTILITKIGVHSQSVIISRTPQTFQLV